MAFSRANHSLGVSWAGPERWRPVPLSPLPQPRGAGWRVLLLRRPSPKCPHPGLGTWTEVDTAARNPRLRGDACCAEPGRLPGGRRLRSLRCLRDPQGRHCRAAPGRPLCPGPTRRAVRRDADLWFLSFPPWACEVEGGFCPTFRDPPLVGGVPGAPVLAESSKGPGSWGRVPGEHLGVHLPLPFSPRLFGVNPFLPFNPGASVCAAAAFCRRRHPRAHLRTPQPAGGWGTEGRESLLRPGKSGFRGLKQDQGSSLERVISRLPSPSQSHLPPSVIMDVTDGLPFLGALVGRAEPG